MQVVDFCDFFLHNSLKRIKKKNNAQHKAINPTGLR